MRGLFIAFFTLLVTSATLLYLYAVNLNKTSVTSNGLGVESLEYISDGVDIENLVIKTASDVSGLGIDLVDKDAFSSFLDEIGFFERLRDRGIGEFNTSQSYKPQTFVILLTQTPGLYVRLMTGTGSDERLLRALDSHYDPSTSTYTLKVFVDPALTEEQDPSFDQFLTTYILQGIYSISHPFEDRKNVDVSFQKISNDYLEGKRPPIIVAKRDLVRKSQKVLEALSDALVPPANAQACGGNAGCKLWESWSECTVSKSSCQLPVNCPLYPAETCTTKTACTGLQAKSCIVQSGQCVHPGCSGIENCGVASNTCGFGASTPPPGGGGGGTCGSCSAGSCQGKSGGSSCGSGGTCKQQGSNTCSAGGVQCSCQGQCSATNPGTTTLVAPDDGAISEELTVLLDWNSVSSWGTGCPNNTNRYRVYVEEGNTTPDNLVATLGSGITEYLFYGQPEATYYWRIQAHNGSNGTYSIVRSFTVSAPNEPWWQVKDADILSTGSIASKVPSALSFILDGLGGFPGVVAYGSSLSIGDGSLSSRNWSVNTMLSQRRTYDFKYLERQIPSDVLMNEIVSPVIDGSELVSGGGQSRGYYWYSYEGIGDLTISEDISIPADRKVILLVNGGNLYLNGRINIQNRGSGFFLAMVGKNDLVQKGNIYISEDVGGAADSEPEIEGLFLADGSISTGTAGVDSDSQLRVRGSLAAYDGIALQRDLPDDSETPAEFFEFAPDLLLLYPPSLSVSKFQWQEVAP
jgi:hypothetical protein